ncbi:ComF family protein [Pseudarthrobacter sp. So.54]
MRQPFRAEAQAPALMDVDGSVLLPVVAAGTYRAELAQTVLSFKRHGQRQLAVVLSIGLARAIKAAAGQTPGLLLVPVPTSSRAYRKRGFSPVHVLLDRIGRTWTEGEPYCRVSTVAALRKTGGRARVAGARLQPPRDRGRTRRAEGLGAQKPGATGARIHAGAPWSVLSRPDGTALHHRR